MSLGETSELGDILKPFECICRSFDGKFMEIIGLKAPGNYSGPFWSSNFSILILENLRDLISMISGFLNASPAPKTNYCLSSEAPGYLKQSKKKSMKPV